MFSWRSRISPCTGPTIPSSADRPIRPSEKLRRASANQSWALIGGFEEHLSTLPGGPHRQVCARAALSRNGIAGARHLCSHTTRKMAALTMSAAAVRPVVARASVARRCVSLARPARARLRSPSVREKSRSRSASTRVSRRPFEAALGADRARRDRLRAARAIAMGLASIPDRARARAARAPRAARRAHRSPALVAAAKCAPLDGGGLPG